jgi:hypothetical protein
MKKYTSKMRVHEHVRGVKTPNKHLHEEMNDEKKWEIKWS